MNPKFILPTGLALTVHAFVLFGLPGKSPVSVSLPDVVPMLPDDPKLRIDPVEPVRATGEESDPNAEPYRSDNPVPRRPDIPVANPGPFEFTVPPLPPIRSRDPTDRIPPDWAAQREPMGPADPGVIVWTDLDRVPRARVQPSPSYPAEMRDQGREGTVVVEFLVDEAGNAYNPAVLSMTVRGFEEAALRAVARWRFEPGLKDGRRVRFRMSVPVVFRLNRE